MELDLNQEPLDHQTSTSAGSFDSMLEELESAEENIRNRIIHLEAITSRARQRRGLPPSSSRIQVTNVIGETATAGDVQGEERREERNDAGQEEGIVESVKGGKRKSSHLIAKALGMEEIDNGKLSYAYSKAKECPVCKGEVTESGIIPIYGHGNGGGDCQMEMKEAGLRVPPRPKAPRVESIRQKLLTQGASSSSIVQSIRRFQNRIGGFGEQVQLESPTSTTPDRNNGLPVQSRTQTDNNEHGGSQQVSRLLEQGASSFSSLSSALNSAMDSAERLVQDLESYINGHNTGGSREQNPPAVTRNSTLGVAATNQSESRARDVDLTNSVAAAASVSPLSRNVDNVDNVAVTGSQIHTTDRNVQVSSLDPSSSRSRRGNRASRQVSNEPRRRRRLR
ncbi:hypothetical protein MtrunA17_Chr4g0013301 [Medicago truncatula]|uniref:E3 ubiquitin-protein ligase RMA n=1 Tax=Medicago truncatula TaxID=3880 RepID=A0A396I3U1_MEDTR|nr:hypothetical protein MtrunA17_Chr4g0013301 [Medicago truncatula]